MPELQPIDPINAINFVKTLYPKTTIKVIKIDQKQQIPWYYVETKNIENSRINFGWINSTALIGQINNAEHLKKHFFLNIVWRFGVFLYRF